MMVLTHTQHYTPYITGKAIAEVSHRLDIGMTCCHWSDVILFTLNPRHRSIYIDAKPRNNGQDDKLPSTLASRDRDGEPLYEHTYLRRLLPLGKNSGTLVRSSTASKRVS